MYDFFIVGAGFSGCVLAERLANILGKKILLVDKRNHIGGNAYDYYNSDGILIHKYGPHWFHTNSEKVFNYLSKFTEWHFHEHIVKSNINGKLYPFPINMDTLNILYNLNLKTEQEVKLFYENAREKINNPKNSEEMVLSLVGRDLFEKFYKNYTFKQWELEAKDLAASVTARIPIRFNRDNRYFTDRYQGLPKFGYIKLFQNMLRNKSIEIQLNVNYKEIIKNIKFKKMIYTGPIDEFFDSCFGNLPYRSLKFEHETLEHEYYQECQQINFPNENKFTRIVEWKHATMQKHHKTTITREFSLLAENGMEKYYPIPREVNQELYLKYFSKTKKMKDVIFCGRLGEYKYYNMDQVIARALTIFEKGLIENEKV